MRKIGMDNVEIWNEDPVVACGDWSEEEDELDDRPQVDQNYIDENVRSNEGKMYRWDEGLLNMYVNLLILNDRRKWNFFFV